MQASSLARLFPERIAIDSVRVDSESECGLDPLHPSEEQYLSPRAVDKRRLEFRAGRHAARRALHRLGSNDSIPIGRDSDRVPVFPRGIVGSIAHTGSAEVLAVAAVARAPALLGIDVEELTPLEPELVERIATTSELTALTSAVADNGVRVDRCLLPVLAFSLKEAAYKCLFPRYRRMIDFPEARLDVAEGVAHVTIPRFNDSRVPLQWTLVEGPSEGNAVVSVAFMV